MIGKAEFDRAYDETVLGSDFVEFADYYRISRPRYWRTFQLLERSGLHECNRIIEFGGGQLAILIAKLTGKSCTVSDVSEQYRAPIDALGLHFLVGDLGSDPVLARPVEPFDLVIALEVIEHIPLPPHVVYDRLKQVLSPSGRIFITTPNLFRLRNIVRMIAGRDYLDKQMLGGPGIALGHQHEYSLEHMCWQFSHAGYAVETATTDMLGAVGHSRGARIGRWLATPLTWRKAWREELVVMARKSG